MYISAKLPLVGDILIRVLYLTFGTKPSIISVGKKGGDLDGTRRCTV